MSKPKLTPWFPGSIKPARPGVYLATILMERDLDDERGLYRYWNGKHWCKPASSPSDAAAPSMQRRAIFHITYWRGRANAPRVQWARDVAKMVKRSAGAHLADHIAACAGSAVPCGVKGPEHG